MTTDHVGPRRHPVWIDAAAQLIMFGLGALCVLYPIFVSTSHVGAYLVTGLVLLGIVRLPDLIPVRVERISHHDRPNHRRDGAD